MPIVDLEFGLLRHPRLAVLATSAWPAWLWTADASRLLWANAVAAAIFGATDTIACVKRRFDAKDPLAAQINRLAATLPTGGPERLERLRGFAAGFGRALTCACSRIVLDDGTAAILIAAAEPTGPALTLGERVRRLFAEDGRMLAGFASDGNLLYASDTARAHFGGATTLGGLGIDGLAAKALETGSATGTVRCGPSDLDAAMERLGSDASRVLVLTLAEPARQALPQAVAAETPMPVGIPAATAPQAHIAPPLPPPAPASTPMQASATTGEGTSSPRARAHDEPAPERRHPLRFVWQMDADGRFVVGSDEFIALVGPRTMSAFGRRWSEIATELKLDPDNQVARAVATQETWSGITIFWPADELSERLPVEMSGLPVFDRDHSFRGYRGFGVCRDIARINQLARARRERPIGFMPAPESALTAGDTAPPVATTVPAAAPAVLPHPVGVVEAAAPAIAAAAESAWAGVRPADSVAPTSAKVVPFRPAPAPEPKAPSLSPVERNAFRELAQELTARLRGSPEPPDAVARADQAGQDLVPEERPALAEAVVPTATPEPEPEPAPALRPDEATALSAAEQPDKNAANSGPVAAETVGLADQGAASAPRQPVMEEVLLDRIPVGVLIYRNDSLLYTNRHFLELSGYETLEALAVAGGLNTLFAEPAAGALSDSGGEQSLSIVTKRGDKLAVAGRLFTVPWHGAAALALLLTSGQAEERRHANEAALSTAESESRELRSIIDATTDGVLVLGWDGRVLTANSGAAALFGREAADLGGSALGELFAPESERAVRDYFDRAARGAIAVHEALDVEAPGHQGAAVVLAMRLVRIGADRLCAVFRDATARKKIEDELRSARREVQKTVAGKAEFLAKLSHEIRTPLNAVTGFAEVIMAERFGPIGNERYREYLKDIHAAGAHLVSLLNDLLDLSKIETGQLDLTFANVNLNDLTQQCVAIMQPQANRARIIIRTSLTPGLPQVVADERSLRQIVLNLLSHSIRFTGPGGQVIVSTAFSDTSEAVLRVRDTGVGMSEKDVEAALEPFRQTATSASWGSGGSGLGLPLTKALAEANRANFSIKSAPNAGTLVEVAFPPARVNAG